MDMALFNLTGVTTIQDAMVQEYTEPANIDSATATQALQVICGKVLKYLLTNRGTDAFDPKYGGRALHRTHISETLLTEIRLELLEDIRDCLDYIKSGEEVYTDYDQEKLLSITLVGLNYNRELSPDRIEVHLLIKTTLGNNAVVQVKA